MRREAEKSSYPFNRKLKRAVKERDGDRCLTCGVEDTLTVHHVDGDRSNNHPSNLVTLCALCHKKIHSAEFTKKRRRKVQMLVYAEDRVFMGIETPDFVTILRMGGKEKY